MILSASELESLATLSHRSPHSVLGMHPLDAGKGLVVRAFIPDAAEVTAICLHGLPLGNLPLVCVDARGIFEGVRQEGRSVYAYDLEVIYKDGSKARGRDPYSFLPTLSEQDLYLFGEGNEHRLFEKLGAQRRSFDGVDGVAYSVWAPNAQRVSVLGDFNQWDGRRHCMRLLGTSGVWEIFIPGAAQGDRYKFEICDATGAVRVKVDPFAFYCEQHPGNASIVWDSREYKWGDHQWMDLRRKWSPMKSPVSIYELHLGSWLRSNSGFSLGYRQVAGPLARYVKQLGFSHVELMPLAEHAYYPSWGYQVTGFYASTSRYGTPSDFQYLVDVLHQAGIGVIVDWVPAHFPRDDWALARFDGTALFEHEDPRQGAHQDWGTLIFNFGRHEVRNFLLANALYWCERFHVDGLRVDAVASMLYLDYSRREGEWVPNRFGGRENLEAVEFLRQFNHLVHTLHPGVMTIAEESTAWPQVTRPPYIGGLGFSLKWNMGWMHDTLGYFSRDPVFRKYHQNDLTFAMLYHYHENFVLALSHDEVVHGKRSLMSRMPGDAWRAAANLRSLFGYQWLFPGKKLVFMGGEFGQWREWDSNAQIDWDLVNRDGLHLGLQRWVGDLNRTYAEKRALHEAEFVGAGFEWVDCSDNENSVLTFLRFSEDRREALLVILNLTPMPRTGYRVGVDFGVAWREVLNSDSSLYGGSNVGNGGKIEALSRAWHGRPYSLELVLPPLGVLLLEPEPS